MLVLARSDQQAQRHGGISCFLVPLDAPGITMLPLENMADGQQNQTFFDNVRLPRSEDHTSELQSLMRTSYAVFCLKKKKQHRIKRYDTKVSIRTYNAKQ